MPDIELKQLLNTPEYRFLQENEHLGKNLMFVALGGSHAYGTADEYSDIDLRGCTINTASDLLGLSNFDCFHSKQTDTTINSLFRLTQLLLKGDMGAAELLGCDKAHYALVSPLGAQLLENRTLFFSQRITGAYAGYIYTLRHWLETADSRRRLGRQCNEKRVLEDCENSVNKFNKLGSGARLYLDKTDGAGIEVYLDVNVNKRPLRDYFSMLGAMQNVVNAQEASAENRRLLDDRFVAKKMCVLLRMLYTCCELLETSNMVTFRAKEQTLLKKVRAGAYNKSASGGISQEYWALVRPLLERMEYAKANTALPAEPDMDALNALVMSLNRQMIP